MMMAAMTTAAAEEVGSSFIYGGTPADQAIVRCIRDLKSRGLRVVFYPFILMTASGKPWRGRITYNGTDISSAATTAVDTHRRARYRQRPYDLLDGAVLLKIGASYLPDLVHANHPLKSFPAPQGQKEGR
jgi:hypothetical protein